MQGSVGFHEGLLGEVRGLVGISDHMYQKAKDPVLVAANDGVERGFPPLPELVHQLGIGGDLTCCGL